MPFEAQIPFEHPCGEKEDKFSVCKTKPIALLTGSRGSAADLGDQRGIASAFHGQGKGGISGKRLSLEASSCAVATSNPGKTARRD
jgi:hypothetical protein